MNLFPVSYHFLGTYKYGRHLDRLGCFYEDADEDGAICIVPFCMLLLAYHVSNIAPARDVAPRSHSTPSPHIAARSHIASNLHLALPSLISCALYRSYCTCSASILCVARILQLNLLTSPILLLSRKIYWDQDYI